MTAHTVERITSADASVLLTPASGVGDVDLSVPAPAPTPGVAIVRKFPFAFDSAGISTPGGAIPGFPVYVPTIGDILLDLWVEIGTAWDGLTPAGDVGMFTTGIGGWFDQAGHGASIDMTVMDGHEVQDVGFLTAGHNQPTGLLSETTLATFVSPVGLGTRIVPGKFVTADPIKVVVSQDGTNTGADPGSAHGAAILYVVTATPV